MLLLRKHHLRSCLTSLSPLNFTSSIFRLLTTAPIQEAPSPATSDFAVRYLIHSCGLPSDRALRAAKRLPHLKSPEKPDAVRHFLRQSGVTEPYIRAAAWRDPSFLSYNLEKCLKPRMAVLQEIGFSPSHISLLLSICPNVFSITNLKERVQVWIQILGSVEKLLYALKRCFYLLTTIPETTSANLSFLQEQCRLSDRQIARLIMLCPGSVTCSPEILKINVKRAEELGVSRSSGMFIHALRVVTQQNPSTIDAKVLYLRSVGLSEEEVANLVSRLPHVLSISEESLHGKMEFLLKKATCDILHLVKNPFLLTLSLEKQLIPRSLVRNLLVLKRLPVANLKFALFAYPTEERFLEKFVLPYENIIPGLHQAYKDVCAGGTERIEWFNSISS